MSDVLAAIGRVASGEKQLPDDAPEGMRQEHSLGGSSRSSAKRVGSMFPPDTRTPTLVPLTSILLWKTAAAAKQPVGSTTSFMRLAKKLRAAT